MSFSNRPGTPQYGGEALGPQSTGVARFPLSTSPHGVPVLVNNTATLIHSCSQGAMEEVYLWAHDFAASSTEVTMSITFSGSSNAYANSRETIISPLTTKNGMYLIYPGVPHRGVEIYAKAAAATAVNIVGFVLRHYPKNLANQQDGYDGSARQ